MSDNSPNNNTINNNAGNDDALTFTDAVIPANEQTHIKNLLTNVYSDPRLAVVRELVTNALDAHTQAGKTLDAANPVEIHAPTMNEPWFSVTDHGIGMSPDEACDIFANYTSTKRTDTAVSGTFGIGAKAPFAVTDRFTATLRKDGTTTEMVFAMRPNSSPGSAIASVAQTPDETNGVTVVVPITKIIDAANNDKVNQYDIHEWNKAISHVHFWAPAGSITIVNVEESTACAQKYEQWNSAWKFLYLDNYTEHLDTNNEVRDITTNTGVKTTVVPLLNMSGPQIGHFTENGHITVLSGTVAYPAKTSKIVTPAYEDDTGLTQDKYDIMSLSTLDQLLIIVEPKSLDIAPSRESIQTTERTKKTITASIHEWLFGHYLDNLLPDKNTNPSMDQIYGPLSHVPRNIVKCVDKDKLGDSYNIAERILGNAGTSQGNKTFSHSRFLMNDLKMDDNARVYIPNEAAKRSANSNIDISVLRTLMTRRNVRWMRASELEKLSPSKQSSTISKWRSSHDNNLGLVVVPDTPSITSQLARDVNNVDADGPVFFSLLGYGKTGTNATPTLSDPVTYPGVSPLRWVTVEDIIADTKVTTTQKPDAPVGLSVFIRNTKRWGGEDTTMFRTQDQLQSFIKERNNPTIIAGTRQEINNITAPTATAPDGSKILTVLTGGRKTSTIAKILGVDPKIILTPVQWEDYARSWTLSLLTPEARSGLAIGTSLNQRGLTKNGIRFNVWSAAERTIDSVMRNIDIIKEAMLNNPALAQNTDFNEMIRDTFNVFDTAVQSVETTSDTLQDYMRLLFDDQDDTIINCGDTSILERWFNSMNILALTEINNESAPSIIGLLTIAAQSDAVA